MFERFTEKARRVIFFARYEASQYGSKYIDTEHILLGFLKEEKGLLDSALGSNIEGQIRSEIENTITKDERLATPTEVPLSGDSKKILLYAAEQATEMRHHYIEPTHILLGAFMTKGSRAAQILARTGVTQEGLRQLIEKRSASHRDPLRSLPDGQGDQAIGPVKSLSLKQAEEMVIAFLASFKAGQWTDVIAYLADHARFIDAAGNRWAGHGELHAQFEQLSSSYANQDASFVVESANRGPGGCVIASILWEGVANPNKASGSMQRMTVIVGDGDGKSMILFVQATPIHVGG